VYLFVIGVCGFYFYLDERNVVFEYRLDELKNIIDLRVVFISIWRMWMRTGYDTNLDFVRKNDGRMAGNGIRPYTKNCQETVLFTQVGLTKYRKKVREARDRST
jgi:hypothetical protein